MQHFTKIAAIVLIVASCALAREASNSDNHALSQRGLTDVSQHYQDISKRAHEGLKQLFLRDAPRAPYQDISKRAHEGLKQLFLRDAPHVLQMLKRAASELSKRVDLKKIFQLIAKVVKFLMKKTTENMEKIKKFLDSIDVTAMIKDIDKVEHFLEKFKVGLQKMAQVIKWLKTNGNIE